MYKEIKAGNTIDIKKQQDKPVEGVYQGFKGITTKIGNQFIYRFKDLDKETIFGIYGFTTLNMAMENVVVGSKCQITYLGMKEMDTKYGHRPVHICRVEVDDDFVPTEITDTEPF